MRFFIVNAQINEQSGSDRITKYYHPSKVELTDWEKYEQEVLPLWMVMTKDYGLTIEDIDNSNPKELEPYELAYKLSIEQDDYKAWLRGYYNYVAFGTVMAEAFSKRGHKTEPYPKEPFSQKTVEREMTKEELDSLPPEEKEKVLMQVIENMMAPAVESFNKMKESEKGERDG